MSNLIGFPYKLQDFHALYPNKLGLPRRLNEWIKAWEDGVNDLSHLEDDYLMANLKEKVKSKIV
jgi:hypothetical protein